MSESGSTPSAAFTAAVAIVAAERKQGGVDADAVAIGRRVHGNVNGGAIGVGEDGALIDGEVGVGIAQYERRNAAAFQFLAQAARQRDGDVFF